MSDSVDPTLVTAYFEEEGVFSKKHMAVLLGEELPTITDLCSGVAHCGGSVEIDAATYTARLQLTPRIFSSEVLERLRAVSAKPTPESITELRTACLKTISIGVRKTVLIGELVTRCDFWLTHLGDKEARDRTIRFVFEHSVYNELNTPWKMEALNLIFDMLMNDVPSVEYRDCLRTTGMHKIRDLFNIDHEVSKLRSHSRSSVPTRFDDVQTEDDLFAEDAEQTPDDDLGHIVILSTGRLTQTSRETKTGIFAECQRISGMPMPLLRVPENIQKIAGEIKASYPWLAKIVDVLIGDLVGRDWIRFRHTVLVGPPGCGKTRFVSDLAGLLGQNLMVYNAAGAADASFAGTSRNWSTGRPSIVLQHIIRAEIANPLMSIDELEKAGTSTQNGRLSDALIPFLEPESSCQILDPYLEVPVDLSSVSFLMTANGLDGVSHALRDRLRVIQIPEPTWRDLGTIVRTIVQEIRIERGVGEDWLPDFEQDELNLLKVWRGGSIRPLRRLVETVLNGRETFAARH